MNSLGRTHLRTVSFVSGCSVLGILEARLGLPLAGDLGDLGISLTQRR